MAFDFPASPAENAEYTPAGGVTYIYKAPAWKVKAALEAQSYDVGRNLLHNSMFNINQRGTASTSITASYPVDRWVMVFVGGTMSSAQLSQGDSGRTQIGDESARYELQVVVAGAATAGSESYFEQRIEGLRRTAGKTITVSFWARSVFTAAKLSVVPIQQFGTGGTGPIVVAAQLITLTTTRTRYALTFAIPSVNGKTFGTAGTDCLILRFGVSAATSQSATYGSLPVQDDTFNFWGMQLEYGSAATPLEKPDPELELRKCQRSYYQGNWILYGTGAPGGVAYHRSFPVQMRTTPTTVTQAVTSSTNFTGITLTPSDPAVLQVYGTIVASGAASAYGTFTASADL